MGRPITLFTGQWADLPLEDVARKASEFGYQGLELACWGDHFEVARALSESGYCASRRDLLERYDLQVHAIARTWLAKPCWTRSMGGTKRYCRPTYGVTAIRRGSTVARRKS